MKLYLQNAAEPPVDDARRQEFYRAMLEDSDRLLGTIEQVLRAGRLAPAPGASHRRSISARSSEECVSLARSRYRLPPDALTYHDSSNGTRQCVLGDKTTSKRWCRTWSTTRSSIPAEVRVDVELERPTRPAPRFACATTASAFLPLERKRIFKRFYRVPGTMRSRTGWGLSSSDRWSRGTAGRCSPKGRDRPGQHLTVHLPIVAPQ